MSRWPERRLRDVIRPRNEIVHPRDRPSGDFLFVGLEHIEPNTGRRIGSLPVRLEDLTGRKARFRPGDIVYGYLRPYLNKVWVANFDGYCSVDQYVFTAGPSWDPAFVAAFMRSPQFLELAPIEQTPGQLPRIRLDEVLDVLVRHPPLGEQRRIAARLAQQLASVDRARQVARGRLDLIGDLVRAELRSALEPDEREWRSVRLTDVVEIQLGKMLSPASRTGRRPVPYLRNANVQWDRLELSDIAEMDYDEDEEAKFRLLPGDVLVCEGGEPGRAAVWRGEIERCCYQKALHRLRPIANSVDPQFLVYRLWLGARRGEFSDEHAQTTIAHLPAVRLATLVIALPSIAEQRRIEAKLRERLATIEATRKGIEGELEAIEALPAALLRRPFQEIEAA